jgi:hypothetical protein
MSVLVRLTQILVDGLASEAEATVALASFAQRENFLGGRLYGPGIPPYEATGSTRAPESWRVQAFFPAARSPLPDAAREVPITGVAFRLCGLDAGAIGMAWADDLAGYVTKTGTWTDTEADLEADLSKLPSGARAHVRSELVAKGIATPNEPQIDLCLEAARQRWADRRIAALRFARDMRCKTAADFTEAPARTPERVALENAAWDAKHEDFKDVGADGTRRMLYLNPNSGHTESWPLDCLPTEELQRCAGAKAPPCLLKLGDLDLCRPHGEQPTVVMLGRAGGEVARGTSVLPGDRLRFRADIELVEAVTAAATVAELRAFILANRRIPATDTATHKVTHHDLAAHAHCIVMDAWWPETVVERLPWGAP